MERAFLTVILPVAWSYSDDGNRNRVKRSVSLAFVNLGSTQWLCCHGMMVCVRWECPHHCPKLPRHQHRPLLVCTLTFVMGFRCLVYKCTVPGSVQSGTQLYGVHVYIMVMVLPSCVHPGLSTGESVPTATHHDSWPWQDLFKIILNRSRSCCIPSFRDRLEAMVASDRGSEHVRVIRRGWGGQGVGSR